MEMIYQKDGLTYAEGCGEWNISVKAIETYRALLTEEMKKRGASDSDIEAVKDATIRNAIRQGVSVENAAWAILS